jgi:UPF0755 protein
MRRLLKYIGIIIVLAAIWIGVRALIAPPSDFPVPYRLTIEEGQSLFSISHELQDAGAIKYTKPFEMFMIVLGSERRVSEGEYYFKKPATALEIAFRISGRQFGIDRTKVTFPEGFTAKQMSDRLGAALPDFDTVLFLTLAKESEGYLFPDTYSFFPSVTPDVVVALLKRNFEEQLVPLQQSIRTSGRSQKDIIIMASIIEKEANKAEEMPIISGILWKRIDQGMAMQVDAPFLYTLGKESSELTRKDLASNSPYNTYKNKGLPPGPISNPGLDAIKAAAAPVPSDYYYYLHDRDGGVHFAKTYKEHQSNIAKYLR